MTSTRGRQRSASAPKPAARPSWPSGSTSPGCPPPTATGPDAGSTAAASARTCCCRRRRRRGSTPLSRSRGAVRASRGPSTVILFRRPMTRSRASPNSWMRSSCATASEHRQRNRWSTQQRGSICSESAAPGHHAQPSRVGAPRRRRPYRRRDDHARERRGDARAFDAVNLAPQQEQLHAAR